MSTTYPGLQPAMGDPQRHLQRVAEVINRINSGRINVTALLTLNSSATSTALNDNRITAQSFIQLMPLSASAATALAGVWFGVASNGTVTVHHGSSAATDMNFEVLIIG